jgi:hypothetical protein
VVNDSNIQPNRKEQAKNEPEAFASPASSATIFTICIKAALAAGPIQDR